MNTRRAVLSAEPVGAAEYAQIEQAFARLLDTRRDFLLLQGEAILALEAATRGLGGPGFRVLNVVTGPDGSALGAWFRQSGALVEELAVPFDRAVSAEAVATALARGGHDLVSVVHAEAATGAVNPLAEVAARAHAAGALVFVDAVASLGAEPLDIDGCELDLVVVSAQKALAGPTGVSAVVVGPRAWERLEANPAAPRQSILSLLDWREGWLLPGRRVLPLIPHHVETRLLAEALELGASEGLARVVARHAAARSASRRGLRALGLAPWVESERAAASVATMLRVPDGLDPALLLEATQSCGLGAILGPAPATLSDRCLRINHTGARAAPEPVVSALVALGSGLRRLGRQADLGGAVTAALADER